MGIIRKRLATSREPSSAAQDDGPKEGEPARPLDERASAAPLASTAPVKRSKRANEITRPLVIVRVRSKPRQLAPPVNETGAPDWSLNAGVAIVLFGFAIAFGTYATLTQREAVQTHMRRFAKHDEPRPAAQPDLVLPAIPAVQVAEAPRSPVETHAAIETATIDTQPSHTPSAPPLAVARSKPPEPARPSTNTSPPAPAKPATRRSNPPATPALARAAPKSTAELASTPPARVQAAPPAPKAHRAAPATAETSVASVASSQASNTPRDERTVHEPVTARPPARTVVAATAPRDNVPNVSDTPAISTAPAPAQPHVQTETTASLQSTVNRELFRRH
ncbi:hypothetical protein G3N95_00615 [Paraburkholderia sp. Tr-20389]|uniref:hypothetical protein n=1 Tax=Paraburkholderia sp. Tr-20389 TaxID=2703903 RepID=UPI00197E59D7|nr:hypothetical protein [Paraburkholderia sp. Tr-20389]MBN3751425.1 hypothetical protein [Paraburkholderia sp. Tr-20389]